MPDDDRGRPPGLSRLSYADLLIHGGRICRGLREGVCEALAVHGGRVVAAGILDAVGAHHFELDAGHHPTLVFDRAA